MNEELKVIIRAEMAQFKQAMSDAISGLKQLANEGKKASKEVDGLTADVAQQGQALKDLKKKYVDLAAAHGKESKAAKEAAEQIKKLSTEYKNNKSIVSNLSKEADGFDLSLGGEEADKDIKKANNSFDDLKGTLQGIYALDIWEFIRDGIGDWSKQVENFADTAKEEFKQAGIYFKQAWGEFFRNPDTMRDLEVQGESYKESIKGAGESAKYGLKDMGQGIAAAIKALGAGILAAAGIIVGIIITIVALVKNALNVAKEIKAMANQASKAGMDTSTYQEWGYVLKQVGIEEDKLSDFTKKLAERQNELRDGSEEAAKAFEALGISSEEALGLNQEQLFRRTVVALQNVENSAERTSLAFRVFTDDATDLTNLLYLTNEETSSLVDNYYALGAAPSENLIQQSKILESSTMNLSYAWQGLKNTLAEWVIPAVIKVVQWLTTAIAYVNAFFQGIFHTKAPTEKATNNVSEGIDKIGKSADDSKDKVKELLRYTMGFDELNIIPKQSSDSSGSSFNDTYSNTSINPDIPVIEAPDLTAFREWMDKYGIVIQSVLTWVGIIGGLLLIVFGICFFNIPMIIAGIAAAGLGISIGQAGGDEGAFGTLVNGLKDIWEKIKGFFIGGWNSISEVWSGVATWFDENVIQPIADFFSDLWSGITTGSTWEGIKNKWDKVSTWFDENVIQPISNFFSGLWSGITTEAGGSEKGIKGIFAPIANWFNEKVIQPVSGFFSGLWGSAKTAASDAWKGIKEVFAPITDWFSKKFGSAWAAVKKVFSSDGETFKGIKEGISETFKTIVNRLIDGINRVIAVPFNAINKMLNKIRNISVLGLKPFENSWGENPLSVPQIPKLAKGGIVNSSILANIGERGKEAVLPLEQNTGWMDTLADRIASRNNTPSRIVLQVDGKELGYATINSINGITRQTGTIQLVI